MKEYFLWIIQRIWPTFLATTTILNLPRTLLGKVIAPLTLGFSKLF